jgi:hypothetical protein
MRHVAPECAGQEPARETRRRGSRSILGNSRFWLALAAAVLIASAAFSWSWLVAVGVAPLLLTLLPCAVMCALGLCMRKDTNASCHDSPQEPTTRQPPVHVWSAAGPACRSRRSSGCRPALGKSSLPLYTNLDDGDARIGLSPLLQRLIIPAAAFALMRWTTFKHSNGGQG